MASASPPVKPNEPGTHRGVRIKTPRTACWIAVCFMVMVLTLLALAPAAFAGNSYPSGQCTWYAQERRQDLPWFSGTSGYALNWATSAANAGFAVGSAPIVGSIAVFGPGKQGAGPTGHVAYVEQVYSATSFRVSEMNFPTLGVLRTDRTAYTGTGVQFIYYYCSAWKGEYYNNASLSGNPTFTRNDSSLNFDWGYGSPGGGLGADNFSVRWTRTLNFAGGTWSFHTYTDDGVRLWVDNSKVIDQWHDMGSTQYNASVNLGAGNHTIKMEYYEHGGYARAKLWWDAAMPTPTPVPTPTPPANRSTVVIDDLDSQFQRFGPSEYWWGAAVGYNGHMYYTYTNNRGYNVNWARWTPNLAGGSYEVFSYVPEDQAGATNARYVIHYSGGTAERRINQAPISGWVSLGSYTFAVGTSGYVELGDYDGELNIPMGFDAIKWVPVGSIVN